MKSKITCLTITAFLALTTVAQADFFNGFETDVHGWEGIVTRVASGTDGIASASSSAYHGQLTGGQMTWGVGGGVPGWPGGFTTSIDLYLDTSPVDGSSFYWISSIAQADGGSFDPYVYFGFSGNLSSGAFGVDAADSSGAVGTMSTIGSSGWYTFQQNFYESGDQLQVELSILDDMGGSEGTWLFSDLGSISLFGGSDYAVFSGSTTFAIDNTSMTTAVVPVPGALLLAGFGLSCAGLHLRRRRS